MSSLLGKVKGGKSSAQREELADESTLVSQEISNIKQRVQALTQSQGELSGRLKDLAPLIDSYVKETRGELNTMKQTLETVLKTVESARKGGYLTSPAEAGVAGATSEEGGGTELPQGPITSIMQAADILVKTAHDLANTTATYFPKIDKYHHDIVDQLSLIHQKFSTIDARVSTVEKILKIKTPQASTGEPPTHSLPDLDPALSTIIEDAVAEAGAEKESEMKARIQQKIMEKLSSQPAASRGTSKANASASA